MTIRRLLSFILLLMLALAGYWIWPGLENRTQKLGLLALASMAVAGALWYLRIRGERRWRTVLDAYAERAIAQHLNLKRPRMSTVPAAQRGMATPARP
jgi:hypothetical protein